MVSVRAGVLVCVVGFVWLGLYGTASAESGDPTEPQGGALAEETTRREQLAQDVSAEHLQARIRADELMAEHKFGYARQAVRKAQEMLANQRENIPRSVFVLLDTLGQEKLQAIDQQEIIFLRKRVEAERIAARQITEANDEADVEADAAAREQNGEEKAVSTPQPRDRVILPQGDGLGTMMRRVEYDRMSLAEVLEDLRYRSGANIVANWESLAGAGVEKTSPVSLKLYNVSAGRVLRIILDNLSTRWAKASYIVQDDVVVIASAADLSRIVETRVYDISHLMTETKDKRGGGWYEPGGSDSRSGGSRSGGDGRASRRSSVRSGTTSTEELRSEKTEKIIAMIKAAATQDSWQENGGPGSVSVFGTRLILTQTVENHDKISRALMMMGG